MIGCVEEYFDHEIEGFIYRWFHPIPFDDFALSAEENGDLQWRIIDTHENVDRRSIWCPWGTDCDNWPNWRLQESCILGCSYELRWWE